MRRFAMPNVNCHTVVTVIYDQTHQSAVDKDAIYVCYGNKVTWTKGDGVDAFSIDFKGNCPFDRCHLNQSSFPPGVKVTYLQTDPLQVFEYSITVVGTNGDTYTIDPHVVGGGGN
jgi:hypothetical protein